jgi:amino acid adenylation domain-containing protein/non-ribosomal peptide synthase protein (TIGR01720 family)
VALKRVKEMLRAVPRRGLGFGLLKPAGVPRPQVIFNYLGQFDTTGSWQLDGAASGAERDPVSARGHELTIDALVQGGVLQWRVGFSASRHDAGTVQALARRCLDELEALVAHCTGGAQGATPSDFPLAGLTQAELDAMPTGHIEDVYPLSPMQEGLVFHSLADPRGTAYVNQLRLDIDGLDPARFVAAWQAMLARHAMLRTGFLHERAPALQVVARHAVLPVEQHDWQARDDQAAALDALATAARSSGFDLRRPPLMRLALVHTAPSRHHLVWTFHHVLLDGWSTSQLLQEVLSVYAGSALPAITGRFSDHIVWLQERDHGAAERHWRGVLAGLGEPTKLARGHVADRAGHGEHRLVFSPADTAALVAAAQRERVTVNTLVQAAWALLLARHTGQDTVAFGATVAGRPAELAGAEQLLGLFINTLPAVVTVRAGQPTGDWLRALQDEALALREHGHVPLYTLQRWAGAGSEGLFDSLLVYENYPVAQALKAASQAGLRFGEAGVREQTHYAMTVLVHPGESLAATWQFARAAFDEDEVVAFADQFRTLLLQLSRRAGDPVGDLQLLPAAARGEMMARGGDSTRFDTEPVTRLFERQAALRPDATAVVCNGEALTYRELNRRANQVAHRLICNGVGRETRVGIAADRSVEMVVGLLGVLKAGGAYVPLDPDYPADRLAYMLAHSGVGTVLVTGGEAARGRVPAGVAVLELDGPDLAHAPAHDPDVAVDADQIAYVIYTSGSTGRPKGVMVRHGALTHFLLAMREAPGLGADDVLVAVTSLSFDIAALELYLPLVTGACVVVADRPTTRDGAALARLLAAARATVFQSTPSGWRLLRAGGWPQAPLGRFKGLCGGEALPDDLARDLTGLGVDLWNLYGPTETTIWSAAGRVAADGVDLGQPIASTVLRVLDAELNLLPAGVAGELFIGGVGLARGYLAAAGLTAERFVADPHGDAAGRLYRTGDLVRRQRDGRLVYLGRVDHQVKVRGFRIELGEVESQLLAEPGVREAVVVANDGRLVAYVAGVSLDVAPLAARLAERLPLHMLPGAWVVLDRLPQTPNGKVDRRALPEPEARRAEFEAPQDDVEVRVAAIWSAVLGVDRVGRHDSFLELGGHSILVMQMLARVVAELRAEVPIRDVFEQPTLAGVASRVRGAMGRGQALASLDAFVDSLEGA